MSVRRVQLRRGTGAENDAFTGAVGELTVNTTNNSIRVHDGATLGGSETALANLSNVVPTQNLDFDGYKIVNVAEPEDPQDVATKNYVDTHGGGGGGSLATLSDVDVANVDTGEFLKYSGTEWINSIISTADLTDGLDIAMIDAGSITANLIGNADTSSAWISAMTLNLTGTVITGSVSFDGSATANLNASLNNNSITNAKLVNDSVAIGTYDLALGGTLNLSNDFQIIGGTLSLVGGGGATALVDLTDVDLNLPVLDGSILTYNSDTSTWQNHVVSGDATLSATGTLTLNAIDNAKLVNSSINIGGSSISLGGTVNLTGGLAMTGSTLSVGNVATASALFTAVTLGLGGSVITGSISFDGSQSVEIIADITPESITGGMIADATITNAKLEHDFIAFNSHEVHLGESVTINGTDGEISVVANLGVYTIGLAGTIVATSAIALAKTINLAGNATGSVSLDNALASVTLNVNLGTITNAMLEHDYISVNDFQLHLSNNLDIVGADGITITMDEPNSLLTVGLGTINTNKLSANSITFADSDSSENIALGGTLTFLGVNNETSVFVLNGEVNVGLAENVEIQGNLTIGGSLIVNGTTTSINTVNLDVTDSIVLLGQGTSGVASAVNDAGFIIERGNTQQSASLFWDEGSSHFAVVTADSIGSSTTNIVTQASNLSYADFKANSIIANVITGSTLSITADAQLTIDSEATFNTNVNLKDVTITSTSPVGYLFQTIHDTFQTFVLNSDTGNLETTGNATIQGDLYASNIIESANGLGITLQDTTSVSADLTVLNPSGFIVSPTSTTVYLYVKYGADSVANGEYFHLFKTPDNGSTREVVPLTFLQDGGVNKLAVKAGGIHQYEAVAGAYTNAGNAPNAFFLLDDEGGTYTYQLRAYTNNDDGVEFEVAFSLDNANPAPTYSILYTANDGSAYNTEYLISYDSALNHAINNGATSTINQVSRIVSTKIATGDVTIHQGVLNVNEISALGAGTLILSGDVNLTGTAIATTQIQGDNSTKLATTEYVDTAVAGAGGGSTGNFTFTDQFIDNTVDNIIVVRASDLAQLESNSSYVWVDNNGGHIETTGAGSNIWDFDNDGHLTLPNGGLIKNNAGDTYLIAENNTWTGGMNGFVGSGYFGGTLGTFSVIDSTNTFNILNVDYTNATVEINSNAVDAFQVNTVGGTQVFNIDNDINTITLNGNTTIQGGTLTFAIKDATSITVFSVDSNNGDTLVDGSLTVTGDFTVNGQTTTINTTNMDVTDSLIELAHGTTGAPSNDAGFVIARGDEHNATLFWSESTDTFIFATSASINSLSTGNLLTLGGTLTYGSVRMGSISLVDNQATALDIKEGNNSYLKFVTEEGAERIVVGKKLTPADGGGLEIAINDNVASALNIHESGSSYLKLISSDGNEKVFIGKTLDLNEGNIINVGNIALDSISADNNTIAINLTDDQASALDITEGANSYLKFVTTNGSEKVVFGKKIEAPADSVIADFTFQNGYITSPSNILINSQSGTTTFDDNVVVGGYFKLNQNTQEAEGNNVGVRFDYYDSSLLNVTDMVNGQQYIIVSVGNTDFTVLGSALNNANFIFTFNGNASQNGTTGTVYPTASLTTGFFGHDKSSHVFTMYPDRTDENTIGNAKFNDLTLTSGLLIDMNGTDLIILNSAFAGTPNDNIGITVNRGNYTDAKILWDEGVNRWSVSTPDDGNNPVNPISLITATPGEGARYACSEPVAVANEFAIAIPSDYTNKTAYFLSNGGINATVNLFEVLGNNYDGYVLALFNTDATATMTVDGFGTQTINGDLTKDIPAGGCLTIMARSFAWYIM